MIDPRAVALQGFSRRPSTEAAPGWGGMVSLREIKARAIAEHERAKQTEKAPFEPLKGAASAPDSQMPATKRAFGRHDDAAALMALAHTLDDAQQAAARFDVPAAQVWPEMPPGQQPPQRQDDEAEFITLMGLALL